MVIQHGRRCLRSWLGYGVFVSVRIWRSAILVMEKIGAVKKDRQHMYDLKNEGVDPTVLRTTIQTTQSTLTDLERQLRSSENQRLALIQETQARLGLGEREAAVADLLSRKARFVEEFDSDQSRATRQDEHRRQWIASHA